MPGFRLVPTERFLFGSFVDCNMATAWVGDRFRIFPGKYGEDPVWGPADELMFADGADPDEAFLAPHERFTRPRMPANAAPGTPGLHGAVWFETVYQDERDPSGRTLFALYHNENYPSTLPFDPTTGEGYRDEGWPPGLQGDSSVQAVPRIGIMRSTDGGESWSDRGVILEDRDERMIRLPHNRNNTFPGGVGDPSAVASGEHLYVFFGEYAYPAEWSPEHHDPVIEADGQCISVARIPLADLDDPAGRARRWDGVAFIAPPDGVGQPIRSLQISADEGGGGVSAGDERFYWGPSVSWNEYLECWVMLLGRVDAGYWKGDSVFISFNPHRDLGDGDNAQDWSEPELLLRREGRTLWYPSLQPLNTVEDVDARRTSLRLGRRARLFVKDLDFAGGDWYGSDVIVEFER
ncbi:hypothetical protein [Schumannella luteola]